MANANEPANGHSRWHLTKTISGGDLLTAGVLVVGIIAAYYDLRGRVDVHEYRISAVEIREAEDIAEIKQSIRRMEARMDDLMKAFGARNHP